MISPLQRLFPVLIFFCFALFSGKSASAQTIDNTDTKAKNWADSLLNTMSLHEKIGQMFMISAYSNRNEDEYYALETKIERFKVGGLIFFQGNSKTQAQLINRYQSLSSIPLFIGMDAETGLGMRLHDGMTFPTQITLGAVADTKLIEQMGYEIGMQCKRLGVHINFAPVADVLTNPENLLMHSRSFGQSPELVAERVVAYALGLKKAGIMAVAKHFPGHGDTDTDSHTGLPVIRHQKARLENIEFFPFKRLITIGIDGVMIGHLAVPSIDHSGIAASVSPQMVRHTLQEIMGFKGLIFTDALNMRAITRKFSDGEAELAAFKAGNHILLQSTNLEAAFEKIHETVLSDDLMREELEKRVHQILVNKYLFGLSKIKPVVLSGLERDLNTEHSNYVKQELYDASVTLLRQQGKLLPLKALDTLNIGAVALVADPGNSFHTELGRFADIATYPVELKPSSAEDWQYIVDQADNYDVVILSIHDMSPLRRQNFGVSPSTIQLIRALSAKTRVVICAFGHPLGLALFDEFPNVICGYEDVNEAHKSVAKIIFGGMSAAGHLPLTVSPMAVFNSGNRSHNLGRLVEARPESVGLSTEKLKKVDEIIERAIGLRVFPGCQILVAKKGKVVWHKSFGKLRYDTYEPLHNETLFDLASVTKVSATLQAVMLLTEKGLLDLNLKASDYLPELKGTNKEAICVADILWHQAGLKSFEAFWTRTKTNGQFNPQYYAFSREASLLQVADNLFIKPSIQDSVWKWVIESKLINRRDTSEGYRYLYSDFGLIIMQKLVERITHQPLDEFLAQNFYKPLGMSRTRFNPILQFAKSEIAPTENDLVFRQQQVWGTVHDPNAALLGGVAGHAGLFGTAWDLAKLYQMNLNKGLYAERQYLLPQTFSLFTRNSTTKSHRGLGWDKPNPDTNQTDIASQASPLAFGHTGFTGTVVWVDPKYDLIFIMLSNRVYPRGNNDKIKHLKIRAQVHEAVYGAMEQGN